MSFGGVGLGLLSSQTFRLTNTVTCGWLAGANPEKLRYIAIPECMGMQICS